MNAPLRAPGRPWTAAAATSRPMDRDDRTRGVAVLALTLRTEAGGRPVRALEALAVLASERSLRDGDGLEAACRDTQLFPCWNPEHPRHAGLSAAAGGEAETCRRIALRAAAGVLPDVTGGATHWHGDDEQPAWSLGLVPSAEIGGLLFYRIEANGPTS